MTIWTIIIIGSIAVVAVMMIVHEMKQIRSDINKAVSTALRGAADAVERKHR